MIRVSLQPTRKRVPLPSRYHTESVQIKRIMDTEHNVIHEEKDQMTNDNGQIREYHQTRDIPILRNVRPNVRRNTAPASLDKHVSFMGEPPSPSAPIVRTLTPFSPEIQFIQLSKKHRKRTPRKRTPRKRTVSRKSPRNSRHKSPTKSPTKSPKKSPKKTYKKSHKKPDKK